MWLVCNPHTLRIRTYEATIEFTSKAETPSEIAEYGTELKGDELPVDTYDIEEERVVLYIRATIDRLR